MSRVLALDYGERRIGVAVSDPMRVVAQPLPTILRRRGKRPPYTKIIAVIEEWEVDTIVVGLPVELDGEEGPAAAEVRAFGAALARRADVGVEYWDERFSSARAERELRRLELPARARREKERIDAVAATLILQAYLDAQKES